MPRKLFARTDSALLVVVLLLVSVGALMIYSCTRVDMANRGAHPARKLILQLIWVALGLALMLGVMCTDYSRLLGLAIPLLGFCMALLVVVLVMGRLAHGAQRWIALGPFNVQPSELLKIALILALGSFLSSREEEAEDLGLVLTSLAYVAVPALLVLVQPDLGTPVLLFMVWLTMLLVFGARVAHLGAVVFAFVMLFTAAWGLNVIRPHQKERLTAFLDPNQDPRGAGWQLQQSLIAIGSGHLFGQGIFKGSQSKLEFVPFQETDFIFTVIAEETGFAGSLLVLALFGVLLWRSLSIALAAKDTAGRLMAAGIGGMFLVHIMVNIGMTVGMMPVKGMPLPFVSYGGSNMLANMAAVGLLESIHIHRQKITF